MLKYLRLKYKKQRKAEQKLLKLQKLQIEFNILLKKSEQLFKNVDANHLNEIASEVFAFVFKNI